MRFIQNIAMKYKFTFMNKAGKKETNYFFSCRENAGIIKLKSTDLTSFCNITQGRFVTIKICCFR